LVVYVGHVGLMDFPLAIDFTARSSASHSAIILASASRSYFWDLLRDTKVQRCRSNAFFFRLVGGILAPGFGSRILLFATNRVARITSAN
jgi:hypothetical protein